MSARRAARVVAVALLVSIASACGGGGGGGGGGGSGGFFEARDLASVSPNPVSAATSSGAGDFAADYLRRTNFDSLLVEIDYEVGHPPSSGVVTLIQQRLTQYCDKPGGVSILVDDAIPSSEYPSVVTIDDLDNLSAAHRDHFSDLATMTAAIYVLYVPGKSSLNGGGPTVVLGLTYHGGSIAIFTDATATMSLNVTSAEIEGEGLVHELGHCLGLTNSTVPMVTPHQDTSHGYHDVDNNAVMHWQIHVPAILPNLGDSDFALFDPNSAADLAAFGGLVVPARVAPASVAEQEFLAETSDVVGACATCAATDGHQHAHAAAAVGGGGCTR